MKIMEQVRIRVVKRGQLEACI